MKITDERETKQNKTNKQTNKQTKTIRVSFINYFKEKIII